MPTKSKSTETDLTIVILNYNSSFWLKKTLETLKEEYLSQTEYQVKVVVVDNASTDDSRKLVNVSFRWAELIELEKNVGFSAGNNVALKQIKSRYGMLLNNDMEFGGDSNLDLLIKFMDDPQNKKVGVITPRLNLTNGEIDPSCHRGEPTPWASITYFLGLEKMFPGSPVFSQYHQYYQDLATPHPIAACSGAAMLFRTDALSKVGLLDEDFFMYGEDLDWCKRFREAKYQVWYYPYVAITHHKNKSGIQSQSKQTSTRTKQYFYDTMLQYYDKHYREQYPQWVRNIIKYFIKIKKSS